MNELNFNMSDPWWLEIITPEPDLPPSVAITLIIIGTVGNILVCLSVYLDKKLRNGTTYFLFSLAVTDLLINVIVLPARILVHAFRLKPQNFPLCYLYLVGDDYLTAASAIHICFISAQRYFAIKNPLNSIKQEPMLKVYIKVGLVWLISLLSVIPYITIIAISNIPTRYSGHCPNLLAFMEEFHIVIYMESFVIFIMMAVVIFFFIETSAILFKRVQKHTTKGANGSMAMLRTIGRKKDEQSENSSKGNKIKDFNSEIKALRVVWIVSFAFIIAMGPYAIVNMVYLANPMNEIPPVIVNIVAYLSYTNSVINPILYIIFSKRFRKSFKNILQLKFQSS